MSEPVYSTEAEVTQLFTGTSRTTGDMTSMSETCITGPDPDDPILLDPDSLDCFGGAQRAADLAKVPAVLALAARLHFDAGLRADVAVIAAEQQEGIGYCGDAVRQRLFELGLHQFRDDQENG